MLKVVHEAKICKRTRVFLKEFEHILLNFQIIRAADQRKLLKKIDAAIRELPRLLSTSEAMIHAATATLEFGC